MEFFWSIFFFTDVMIRHLDIIVKNKKNYHLSLLRYLSVSPLFSLLLYYTRCFSVHRYWHLAGWTSAEIYVERELLGA